MLPYIAYMDPMGINSSWTWNWLEVGAENLLNLLISQRGNVMFTYELQKRLPVRWPSGTGGCNWIMKKGGKWGKNPVFWIGMKSWSMIWFFFNLNDLNGLMAFLHISKHLKACKPSAGFAIVFTCFHYVSSETCRFWCSAQGFWVDKNIFLTW